MDDGQGQSSGSQETVNPGECLFTWDMMPSIPFEEIARHIVERSEKEPSRPKARARIITLKEALDSKRSRFPEHDFQLIQSTRPGGFCSFGIGVVNMAEEIPIIPKASELEVRTGNIVNWNRLKRKPNQNPTIELTECITATVKKHLDASNKTELQYVKFLECVDTEQQQQQQSMQDERGELKVIIKLFICSEQSPEVVVEAINKVITELNSSFVETVLLSLSMFECEDDISVDQLMPYWQALEGLVEQKQVFSIGTCDLDKTKLSQLYQWAKVKPSINQVNLASCCVMPKDLTDYAKQVDIQLQTHSDALELLPRTQLKDALRQCTTESDSTGWSPQWVARYSVLVKCRGIIKSKGYIMRAVRDPNQPL